MKIMLGMRFRPFLRASLFPAIALLPCHALEALAASVACSPASVYENPEIRLSLDNIVLDTESTRFKDVRSCSAEKGNPVICGMLNTRNSYGAYTGFVYFVFHSDTNTSQILPRSGPTANGRFAEPLACEVMI